MSEKIGCTINVQKTCILRLDSYCKEILLNRNANSLRSMYLEIKNEYNETPEICKGTQEMDKGRLI